MTEDGVGKTPPNAASSHKMVTRLTPAEHAVASGVAEELNESLNTFIRDGIDANLARVFAGPQGAKYAKDLGVRLGALTERFPTTYEECGKVCAYLKNQVSPAAAKSFAEGVVVRVTTLDGRSAKELPDIIRQTAKNPVAAPSGAALVPGQTIEQANQPVSAPQAAAR